MSPFASCAMTAWYWCGRAPEDIYDRVPERYITAMAEVDAARLPSVETLQEILATAGLAVGSIERVLRNKVLILPQEERALRTEVQSRYDFLTDVDVENALRAMRSDAVASEGHWVDPRPTIIIVASKRPCPSPAVGPQVRPKPAL